MIGMSRRNQRRDHQLAHNWLGAAGAHLRDLYLDEIAGLYPKLPGKCRAHLRTIVPSQLRDRIGHFLEPAVVSVPAVIHGIAIRQHDLRRLERWRERRVPKRWRCGSSGAAKPS